jgi:mono/diheme cytochrome c family protein
MPTRFGPAALLAAAALLGVARPSMAADAESGARIYANYCENCHGEELRNTSSGVTYDLRKLRPTEHDRFINSVTNGKTQMPPWKGVLSEDQMEDVWAYIRATVDKK